MRLSSRRFHLPVALMTAIGASGVQAASPTAPAAAASTHTPTAAASTAPPAANDKQDAEELSTVIVKGKRDLLMDSDARMKKLKESLPDIDSDVGHKEGFAQRVVDRTKDYLHNHSDPNKVSDEGKALINSAQNGVDNAHDAGKPPVAQPDAKDYSDPLCQTGSCPP
jgi:hypothetical protein